LKSCRPGKEELSRPQPGDLVTNSDVAEERYADKKPRKVGPMR